MKIEITDQGKRLIISGAVLFLIGLLQGFTIPFFENSRMALSAHLAAVQSGMALMIFGIIWSMLTLKPTHLRMAYYASIASMYLIWIAITLAAMTGASNSLPIAGEGFSAAATYELATDILLYVGAVAGLISGALIVTGLIRNFREKT